MNHDPVDPGAAPSEDELPQPLGRAVDAVSRSAVPVEAMQRALERARSQQAAATPKPRRTGPVFIAATIAAAVVAALLLWPGQSTVAWAQVAEALGAKPWIHGITTGADGKLRSEFWYSFSAGIAAFRDTAHIEYHDHRQRRYDSYEFDEKVLYRNAYVYYFDEEGFHGLGQVFAALFRADERLGSPAPRELELIAQRRTRVEEGGKTWFDYVLKLRDRYARGAERRMTFRVDARTRLPHTWTVGSLRYVLDYPDRGPVDVYALGVPQSAPLVDQRGAELQRIHQLSKSARQRFDDYYAIVVQSTDATWYEGTPWFVWRKGNRWRIDRGESLGPRSDEPPPADDADRAAWWKQRVLDARFVLTQFVCDGKLIENGGTRQPLHGPADDPFVIGMSYLMPQLVVYPQVGLPRKGTRQMLVPEPTEGPEGTILLRVLSTGRDDPDRFKLWLDPKRQFIAMRTDTAAFTGTGFSTVSFRVEELAKSPSGHWYPLRVRTNAAGREEFYQYFVDFDAELPDTLFEISPDR